MRDTSLSDLVAGGAGQRVKVAQHHMLHTAERVTEGIYGGAHEPCYSTAHGPVTKRRWELSLPQNDWEDSNPAGTAGELAGMMALSMHTPVLLECVVDN